MDVVVVSYNSREQLRACVEPLAALEDVLVVVVDNASPDRSLEVVADLPVLQIARTTNGGFASGCNVGWRASSAPYVLFLNPDAALDAASLDRLRDVLDAEPAVAAVGPRIVAPDGSLMLSQRRYPRLRSTYARALFLHRIFPRATWADEPIRDASAYDVPGHPDWISGACILVRRSALEEIGGFDERFFLYCEEIDLCRRLRAAGHDLRYEPTALCRHIGGASAPRPGLLPVLAQSRVRYAQKHRSAAGALAERIGIALDALTHVLVARGSDARAGHARSLQTVLGGGVEL